MASGVQLATAYISLNVRTDNIKKQVEGALSGAGGSGRALGSSIGSNIANGIRGHLGGLGTLIFSPMEIAGVRWAVRAGAAIGGALKKAIMGAVGGLGIGAIFGVGGVLGAGLDRLKTLQQSTVQLSLKLKPDEIKSLQKQISDVVTGTPIPLDKAMQAVPKAISAGLRGPEVAQYIKDIADLTASTGGQGQFDQLAVIMEQIRSKSKLAGDEMQQLVDAGVDVRGLLKEGMGWDDKTLNQKLKNNKIGIKELQTAIQKVYGEVDAGNGKKGLAQKMGETFDGAIGSLKASAARLGANFISAIFGKKADEDPLKDFAFGINKITQGLNGVGKWVDAHRSDIHNVFKRIGDITAWVGEKLGKFPEYFRLIKEAGAQAADWISRKWDGITSAIGRVVDKIKDIWTNVKTWILDKWDSAFGPNSAIGKFLGILGIGVPSANAADSGTAINKGPMAPQTLPPLADTPPGFTRSFGTPGGGYNSKGQWVPAPGGAAGTMGLSSVPAFGLDANGNQLQSTGGGINPGPMKPGATTPGSAKPGGGVIKSAGTPYGLPAGTDTGGYGNPLAQKVFPPWVFELGKRFNVQPSTYPGHQEGSGMNQGIDWVGTVEEMDAFARALLQLNPPGLKQVIWQNPNTQFRVGSVDNRPVGPDLPDTTDPGYYSRGNNDWADHQNHVHTAWGENLDLSGYASGGSISGPGSGTSDLIPAMLSNGEHVLTAADVKKMGGQSQVYAFRAALQNGMIPGFAPGGAVDSDTVQNAQDNVANLNNQYAVLQAQLNETVQGGEAAPSQLLDLQQKLGKTKRDLDNAIIDLPTIMAGGTPPDRSAQNNVYDATDQLALFQQQLAEQKDAGLEIPYSQQLQQDYQLQSLQKQRDDAIAKLQNPGGETDYAKEFMRTLGFTPTAGTNTGYAGTSSLAKFIKMPSQVAGGLMDTAANLGSMAASAAIAAGTAASGGPAGAAAAASPALSYGFSLAAAEGKVIADYWLGSLPAIAADSLVAQMFPFGAPRWLGYDYAQFMPQMGLQQAATTTLEKMGSDAIQKHFAQNNGAVIPPVPGPANASPAPVEAAPPPPGVTAPQPLVPNQTILQQGDPGFYDPGVQIDPFNPNAAGGAGGGGSWAKGGHVGIYDEGGVLKPGTLALNASTKPEKVLTEKQWQAMANIKPAGRDAPLVKIDTIYGMNPDDVAAKIEAKQRLAMMRYAGRP